MIHTGDFLGVFLYCNQNFLAQKSAGLFFDYFFLFMEKHIGLTMSNKGNNVQQTLIVQFCLKQSGMLSMVTNTGNHK